MEKINEIEEEWIKKRKIDIFSLIGADRQANKMP